MADGNTQAPKKTLEEALREIQIFSDLSSEDIRWLIDRSEEFHFKQGDQIFQEGQPADWMSIILEGEAHFRREGADSPLYIASKGMVTGRLPFSRMTHYKSTGYAIEPLWLVTIHRDHFPEMLRVIP